MPRSIARWSREIALLFRCTKRWFTSRSAVVFTMKIPLVSFSYALMSYDIDLNDRRLVRVELRPGEIRSEQKQHLTVEDGMVAGASADDPRHAHIVGIVVFQEVLAARRMGHRRLQPRCRGDDLVMRASATRTGVDGDRFALVENGFDRI